MDELASFARALADPTRCRIAHLIEEEALCVCELADILGMPQSTVSSHLQVIRKAGLLDSERCEKWIYYRLNAPSEAVFAALREHFPGSAESRAARARDAKRAAKRMAERAGSCCPGPVRLAEVAATTAVVATTARICRGDDGADLSRRRVRGPVVATTAR